jgi:putative DNA primase/helicase
MSIVPSNTPERKPTEQEILQNPGEPGAAAKPIPAAWFQPVPGEEATTPELVYQASLRLVAAGLSIIPIEACEGSKAPDPRFLPRHRDRFSGQLKPSWSVFCMRRPTQEELLSWFERGSRYGLAVVCGAVSGGECGYGLEVIDLDTADLAEPWMDAVEKQAPGLIQRLVRVQTPRPGMHVYYRCSSFGGSQKLACAPATDAHGQVAVDAQRRLTRKTLIEVKAEGGYCLIPPSPRRCHPTGRLYRYLEGSPDLTGVARITPEERAVLFDAARSLNQWQEPKVIKRTGSIKRIVPNLTLPGDDFNARGDWEEILTPHGWAPVGGYGEEVRWCRPGKSGGVSATTNYQGSGLLHVFSSNASPFEADASYTKFSAFAWVNHGGDFTKAAQELRDKGYGAKRLKTGKRFDGQPSGACLQKVLSNK